MKNKIKPEDYNTLVRDFKKIQRICRKYQAKIADLERQLANKNLGKSMPDFMKGFNNKRR